MMKGFVAKVTLAIEEGYEVMHGCSASYSSSIIVFLVIWKEQAVWNVGAASSRDI